MEVGNENQIRIVIDVVTTLIHLSMSQLFRIESEILNEQFVDRIAENACVFSFRNSEIFFIYTDFLLSRAFRIMQGAVNSVVCP